MSPNTRIAGSLQPEQPPMAVLFIDPDTEGAYRLSRMLPGHTMTAVVPTAYAALQAIQAHVPTLIVTELSLPDASGVEMLRRIHANPATHKVLLMVVTQRNSIRDKIDAFEAGADDYLVKPLDPQNFLLHAQLLSRFGQVMSRQQYLPQQYM